MELKLRAANTANLANRTNSNQSGWRSGQIGVDEPKAQWKDVVGCRRDIQNLVSISYFQTLVQL